MASLTAKELQRLTELHARFAGGSFSETDVSSLLILLRQRSRGGPVRELADGVAHSERDRGKFFARILANRDVLNNLGKKEGIVRSGDIFSTDDFSTDLAETLQRQGLDALDRPASDLILLCGLSLLQGGSVKRESKFGELSLALTSERFELHATTSLTNKGRDVRVKFPVASVANRWLPVCNPRAHVEAQGPVRVTVRDFAPVVDGFKPFAVHVERAPPIESAELKSLLAAETRLVAVTDGLAYNPANGRTMVLRYDGARLTVQGLPEFFRMGTDYERVLKTIRQILGACVHDDAGAHWFLDGLGLPDDGFHCHWVGRGSATCTRPL